MRPMRPASATNSRTIRRRESADRALDADLARPLGDAHGHRVDDRQAADDQADDRDADDDRVEDHGRADRCWSNVGARLSASRSRQPPRCGAASGAGVRALRRVDDDLGGEVRTRRRRPRPAAAGSSRNSSWAAASGTMAVVSGDVQRGLQDVPTTSNGSPRRLDGVADDQTQFSWPGREPRTVTFEPSSSAVSRRALAGQMVGIEALVRAGHGADDHLGHAEPAEARVAVERDLRPVGRRRPHRSWPRIRSAAAESMGTVPRPIPLLEASLTMILPT